MQYFDLMKYKKWGFIVSVAMIVILFSTYFFNGLVLDISFKGGTRLTIEATGDINTVTAQEIAKQITSMEVQASMLKSYNAESGSTDITMLRLDVAGNQPLSFDKEMELKSALAAQLPLKLDSARNETASITANIGQETLKKGVMAILVSSAIILFYVAWRFAIMSGFSAAFTAVLALVHDVLMIFGFYIAMKLPLNDIFIATVLTIVGYSINDTIIMYDRIRENSVLMRKFPLVDIVNASIMQTLSRSANTIITTMISTVSLYVFSAIYNITSLRDFGLALSVGMISGMYSSIFIAIPLWLVIREKGQQKAIKASAAS